MGSLQLTEAWTGAWSAEPQSAVGDALQLTITIQIASVRQLRGTGAPLQVNIHAPQLTPARRAAGRLTLVGGQLRYAIETDSLQLIGARALSLRGFPPPLWVMSLELVRADQPAAYANLRLDVRSDGRQLLRSLRYLR